jgi:hypothetical protein
MTDIGKEMIHTILAELNESNSSNHKLEVLKKYSDNELLKQILKMTYDKVAYTYGVTLEQIAKFEPKEVELPFDLEFALASLSHNLAGREVTGHAALQLASNLIGGLNEQDADVLKKVINRDLRINVGKTQINKVFKGLITKPSYMRCDVYSKKTAKNIQFPAIVQLKADGTYREFTVHSGHVSSRSRSGEEYDYPIIFEQMKEYPDGVYVGELTVEGIHERSKGNGLINSDNPPYEDIILELWDYITLDEYEQAALKDRKNPCEIMYSTRFAQLDMIVQESRNVRLIPTHYVDTLQEALQYCSNWMSEGFEGAILKDVSGVFKDGTSKHQLKLKLEISAEMRCTGFQEGSVGTKREGKIGSLIFENDEGTIKGKCSGFSDAELDEFTENFEKYKGKVLEVQFNDLSKADNNDFYALSHPRFIEWRNDKDETDTLEKVFKLREMAMELS